MISRQDVVCVVEGREQSSGVTSVVPGFSKADDEGGRMNTENI